MTWKKIGLALSGGGARGFAHVGVLKVLAEHDIRIGLVAGTSAGSIVGGCLAAGMSVDEISAMSAKVGYANMMLPALGVSGMFSSAPMGNFLKKYLPVKRIEEMPMPFAAIAFDLNTNEKVVYKDSGDLIEAIRASSAVPGVFAPIRDGGGRLVVDGGVVSPLPVDTVRAMGADVVIAVDLMACGATFRNNSRTGIGIMIRSAMALLQIAAANEARNADIVIEPAIAHLRPDQIKKCDEFIMLGERAARERIPDILALIS
jgi:NTE family protein